MQISSQCRTEELYFGTTRLDLGGTLVETKILIYYEHFARLIIWSFYLCYPPSCLRLVVAADVRTIILCFDGKVFRLVTLVMCMLR